MNFPNHLRRTILVLATASLAATTLAWNATGHMVIAAIADRFLTPDVRTEVARLAQIGATEQNSDPFGAAVWADDVRSGRPESAPWHYINLPFRKDGKPTTGKPAEENVVVAIRRFTAILADKTKPDAERAEALRFLMHFVGDIHQPLHAVSFESDQHPTGDRGGNSYPILPPKGFDGTGRAPSQLHSLWDGGAGLFPQVRRPLTPETSTLIRRQADTLIATIPLDGLAERSETDPMKWAQESLEAAKTIAYSVEEGTAPSEAYIRKGQFLAARRAVLAGYRLADLLNKTLG
jgi:hypothetical protein